MIGAKINFLSFDAGKGITPSAEHMLWQLVIRVRCPCCQEQRRDTSEDTLSIRINVLSAVFVEVGVHLSVLLRCRAENRFYDLVCFCRGHPSPIRRPPLTHQVQGLWSVPRYRFKICWASANVPTGLDCGELF